MVIHNLYFITVSTIPPPQKKKIQQPALREQVITHNLKRLVGLLTRQYVLGVCPDISYVSLSSCL